MTEEEIKNYTPKGDIEGFPIELVSWMLDQQEAQGNKRDVSVFEARRSRTRLSGGFDWDKTQIKEIAENAIWLKRFAPFFEKYPKQKTENTNKEPIKTQSENLFNELASKHTLTELTELITHLNKRLDHHIENREKELEAEFRELKKQKSIIEARKGA